MSAPFEGIAGTERAGWLLSLDDQATAHREALMKMAKALRVTCLVGNPAPVVTETWKRVSNPVPGDLVVECTRALHRLDHQGFGILIDSRWEDEAGDVVWYIQYGNSPGDVARWQNCEFMALPVAAR